MTQRLLIIAYYWPPAGGPGVQRWLGFCKHLPELGYDVTVVIPQNAHYPIVDASLVKEIPDGIRTLEVPIKEPSRLSGRLLSRKRTNQLQKGIINKKSNPLQSLLLAIRGNFFIPDARIGWKKAVLQSLTASWDATTPFTLITTGPPHSVHLIGQALKAQYKNCKWIADFRDPWTTIGYHKELKLRSAAQRKHERLEHDVLQNAHHIIVTSPHTKREFSAKTSVPISVITNGYDVAVNTIDAQPAGAFTITHVGTLLANRNPLVLWRAIAQLCEEDATFKANLQLVLAGTISDTILNALHHNGLSAYLNNIGYVSHNEAFNLMMHAQLLVLIEIDDVDTQAIIPGKIFEYLASRRPILAIGPKDAAIQSLIEDNHAGSFYNYSEHEGIKATIKSQYDLYLKNKNIAIVGNNTQQYSRKSLAKSLTHVIRTTWEL